MQTRVIDALACCAAGLCAHSAVSRNRKHQQPMTDLDCPVMPVVEVASSDLEDRVGRIDQPVSTHCMDTVLQPRPSCDACCGSDAQEEVGQDVKEVVVEEDAVSTVSSDSPKCLGDVASVDSEACGVAVSSPEVTFVPDKAHSCQGQLAACSSVRPELNVQATLHVQPLANVSFKTESESKLTAAELAAESFAAAAATAAAETQDANGAGAELEATQAVGTPVDAFSAQIVSKCGKFYTIEVSAADQQDRDLVPLRKLTRRYQQFAALDMELRQTHGALPTLPQKSVFFRRTFKHGFMDDREQRLGAYLSALMADPSVVAEPSVQKFLGMTC
mmetsp:Transcript_37531/g.72202  ORF Transcript_37531/g.72202 Transcript_37531/m.72202 type:complete len:332 (-) Transcript_37531:45-1040(-)